MAVINPVNLEFLKDTRLDEAKQIRLKLLNKELFLETCEDGIQDKVLNLYKTAYITAGAAITKHEAEKKFSKVEIDLTQWQAKMATLTTRMDALEKEQAEFLKASGKQLFITNDPPKQTPPPPPEPPVTSDNELMDEDSNNTQKRPRELDETAWNEVRSKKKTNSRNQNETNNIETAENKTVKKTKIPPFFIQQIDNWQLLIVSLKRVAPSTVAELKNKFIRIRVDSEIEYRNVQSLLTREQIHYRSFLLDDEKHQKFVLRGLPANTTIELIESFLNYEHLKIISIQQMFRGNSRNKIPLPLFLIQLNRLVDPNELHQITDIMGMRVHFERYRGRKGPQQCHRCQGFFHSAAACHLQKRCVKCAGEHLAAECPKPYDEPCRCANCNGEHPASFRQCPKFPKDHEKKTAINLIKTPRPVVSAPAKKVTNALSFAKAATPVVARPAPSAQKEGIQITSAPQKGAISDADFLKQLFQFEQMFGKQIILDTFKKCLPALRAAPTEVDRIFIMYENLPSLPV